MPNSHWGFLIIVAAFIGVAWAIAIVVAMITSKRQRQEQLRQQQEYEANLKAQTFLNEHLGKIISDGAPHIARKINKEFQIGSPVAFTFDALSQGFYDWIKIDDRAINALKFALGSGDQGFTDIYLSASRAADNVHALERLQGYVGEQIAAGDLVANGYVVSFPDSPTQAGYDLIVDGHPVQVKTTLMDTNIHEALALHPDIPVLVPTELMDSLSGTENVIFTPGFSHDLAQQVTQDNIEAISDLGDSMPIPIFTLGFIGYRKIKEVYHGKDPKMAIIEGGAEIGGVTIVGGIGGILGLKVGMAAGAAGAVIGKTVGWGSAAAIGTLMAVKGGKIGAIAGGLAFLVLGPMGAVAVAQLSFRWRHVRSALGKKNGRSLDVTLPYGSNRTNHTISSALQIYA